MVIDGVHGTLLVIYLLLEVGFALVGRKLARGMMR